jgi:hypothetical protein
MASWPWPRESTSQPDTFRGDYLASQAVVRDATDKAHFRLRAAQCHINPRQSKVL